MAAEGEFPKIDGDSLYASEVNDLIGTVNTEEAGPYTHTGNGNLTTVRTYTVGGIVGKGYKVALLTLEFSGDTGATDYTITIKRNGHAINGIQGLTGPALAGINGTDTGIASAIIPVDNGDKIDIQVQITNYAAQTISVDNIKIWCQDGRATFTGS